jgi:hypothetical protein
MGGSFGFTTSGLSAVSLSAGFAVLGKLAI